MHKNNEKLAFYLISLQLSLYCVYFADTNTFSLLQHLNSNKMKHTLFTLALVLLALLSASCGDKKKVVYQNPLPMAFGDPLPTESFRRQILYVRNGGVSNGFKVYSSDDLVTWTDEVPSIKAAPPTHGPPTVSGRPKCMSATANTTYGSAPTGRKTPLRSKRTSVSA